MKTTKTIQAFVRGSMTLFILIVSLFSVHSQASLTIQSVTPYVSNCIPLGNNTNYGFTGFIYRNIPAFNIVAGDKIRFDMGAMNGTDVRRNIYFSTANINPSPYSGVIQGVQASGWVQMVPDTQIPLNPTGDTILGNFELTYIATTNFSFPGGGFLIGFGASPPGAYADINCEQVGAMTTTTDPTGFFYQRFHGQPDQSLGVLDNLGSNYTTELAGFKLDFNNKPPVAVCKNTTVFLDSTGIGTITPSDVDGGSVAPAGLLSLTVSPDTFTCANVGLLNVVILTITDSLGRVDSCRALVKVVAPPLTGTVSAKIFVGGLNISCNGASDGEATATAAGGCPPYTYMWNTIPLQNTATATGLSAGTYSVTITDSKSTSIILSITLTEPNPLIVNAGSNQTVYLGYAPLECADLSGTANGGTPAYSYFWSNGATTDTTTVCPVSSTTYTLTIKDQNDCKASDEIKICVVDVRCEKGGKAMVKGQGNKVLICHKPGNNQKTLCINMQDVPAHLAHGDLLGECGADTTCNDGPGKSASLAEETLVLSDSENSTVSIHPNPSTGIFTVTVESNQRGTVSISISSVAGQPILQLTGKIPDGIVQIPVDLTAQSNGVYIINVLVGQELIIKKITLNK